MLDAVCRRRERVPVGFGDAAKNWLTEFEEWHAADASLWIYGMKRWHDVRESECLRLCNMGILNSRWFNGLVIWNCFTAKVGWITLSEAKCKAHSFSLSHTCECLSASLKLHCRGFCSQRKWYTHFVESSALCSAAHIISSKSCIYVLRTYKNVCKYLLWTTAHRNFIGKNAVREDAAFFYFVISFCT